MRDGFVIGIIVNAFSTFCPVNIILQQWYTTYKSYQQVKVYTVDGLVWIDENPKSYLTARMKMILLDRSRNPTDYRLPINDFRNTGNTFKIYQLNRQFFSTRAEFEGRREIWNCWPRIIVNRRVRCKTDRTKCIYLRYQCNELCTAGVLQSCRGSPRQDTSARPILEGGVHVGTQ